MKPGSKRRRLAGIVAVAAVTAACTASPLMLHWNGTAWHWTAIVPPGMAWVSAQIYSVKDKKKQVSEPPAFRADHAGEVPAGSDPSGARRPGQRLCPARSNRACGARCVRHRPAAPARPATRARV